MRTTEQEKTKYEKIWEFKQYRNSAPGERLVETAIREVPLPPESSIIDFGCGTGRAAQLLNDLNFYVTAVDFAENCMDKNITLPLNIACLWEDMDFTADYGFCTDVMEHIPTEHLEKVLKNISKCVNKAVFFQIATRKDVMGRLIGEPLHLTVEPARFWEGLLLEFFEELKVVKSSSGSLIVVAYK